MDSLLLWFTLVLVVLNFPLTLYPTVQVVRRVQEVLAVRNDKPAVSRMEHRTPVKTMSATLVTSVSLGIGQTVIFLNVVLFLAYFRPEKEQSGPSDPGNNRLWLYLSAMQAFFMIIARVGLLIVLGERMHSVFAHSNYQMSDRTINGYRTAVVAVAFLILGEAVAYSAGSRVLFTVLMSVDILVYFGCSVFLSWSFFDRSRMVCEDRLSTAQSRQFNESENRPKLEPRVRSDTVNSAGSVSHSSEDGSISRDRGKHATAMMDASLRLAILSAIGITSTVLSSAIHIAVVPLNDSPLGWTGVMGTIVDFSINNWCLLCTFRSEQANYRFLLGCFHDYCRQFIGLG